MGAPLIEGFEILLSRSWVDDHSNPNLELGASCCHVVRLQNLGCSRKQIDTDLFVFYFFINIIFNSRAALDKAMEAAVRFDFEAEVLQQDTA
ncbi:MAG: hypothetical protein ACOYMH_11835 [Zwartia sp.]